MLKGKVLVLDDDPDICVTIQGIAELAGYETRATSSTSPFFLMYKEWEPSHVIIDLSLPGVDGIDILRQLARAAAEARVIITSGLGTRVLEAAGRAASEGGLAVNGLLPKPFSPSRLRSLLTAPDQRGSSTGERVASPRTQSHGAAPALTPARFSKAMEQDEFVMYYQPKIACSDGTVVGFEALARWPQGDLPPDVFVPFAESSGLIPAFTRHMFTLALKHFGARPLAPGQHLSLNISARSLVDPAFPLWVRERCETFGVPPHQITLEVTETASMQNPLMTLELLTQFRIHGFALSIDDFGVGYSSLIQLARLPFSEMKIDKTFVTSAMRSAESQKIIIAIIGLAHAMGLQVTAEGVEDAGVLEFLSDYRCDFAQGFHIAAPLPPEHIDGWLQEYVLAHRSNA
ncbi:MAG: EAL domain-containing response regulator [Gammaproteobacteria bacterium]